MIQARKVEVRDLPARAVVAFTLALTPLNVLSIDFILPFISLLRSATMTRCIRVGAPYGGGGGESDWWWKRVARYGSVS